MNWEAQYAPTEGLGVSQQANGRWNNSPNGIVHDGEGGTETLKLAGQPITHAGFVW